MRNLLSVIEFSFRSSYKLAFEAILEQPVDLDRDHSLKGVSGMFMERKEQLANQYGRSIKGRIQKPQLPDAETDCPVRMG